MPDTPTPAVTPITPVPADPAHPSHPIWSILGTVLQIAIVAVVPFVKSPGAQQVFQFEGNLLQNLINAFRNQNPPAGS